MKRNYLQRAHPLYISIKGLRETSSSIKINYSGLPRTVFYSAQPKTSKNNAALDLSDLDFDPMNSQSRKTVLIIDDNHMLLDLAVLMLDSLGFDAMTASDGNDAVAIAKSNSHIDLVLSDIILMEDMNGPDCALKIREFRPEVPIVFMSGYCSDLIEYAPHELQSVPILKKPFTLNSLLSFVSEAIEDSPVKH